MPADNLKAMFFVECEELLESLGEGLQDIETGEADAETLNAVFRAVHSIKGTAGAFGFDTLVTFTHHFETALDLIRSDKLTLGEDVLRLLFRASDILADLVDLARADDPGQPLAMASVMETLVDLASADTGAKAAPGGRDPALAENPAPVFEPLAFDPVSLDLDLDTASAPPDSGGQHYHIRFDPGETFFRNGHDFDTLLAELAKSGPVSCRADISGLPGIGAFDQRHCYLIWDIDITTEASAAELLDAFLFLEEFCEITEVAAETEAEPALPDGTSDDPARPVTPPQLAGADPILSGAEPAPVQDAPAEACGKARPAAAANNQPMLRVDPERVDRLINTVGELIINQAVIAQRIEEAGLDKNSELAGDLDDFQFLAREIQEGVMAIRAQPVKPLFQRMQRIVRETVEALGKDVQIVTEGENTEVDKTLVERLADPLTHMIRNAIDHGIERPDIREAADKPRRGTIRLSAAHRSGHVQIEISDDGAGVNRARVFEKAVENGLIPADAKLSDSEVDNLLFMPGFSTAAEVTNLSGRGVGMDVVKTAISALGGRVAIQSAPGRGTTFTISMPLTLAVMDGMVVHVGGETMVVPLSSIVETIRPDPSDIKPLARDGFLLSVRGAYVPIVSLSAILDLPGSGAPLADGVLVLVRSETDDLVALAVDDISDQRQVVIKSLEGNYGRIAGISAATILGDGRVALIIDTEAILVQARRAGPDGFQSQEVFHEQASALG